MRHRLISAAYSLLQQHFSDIAYTVTSITCEPGYSRIAAAKRTQETGTDNLIYIFAGNLEAEPDSDLLRAEITKDREETSRKGEDPLFVLLAEAGDEEKLALYMEEFRIDNVWLYSDRDSKIRISGKRDGDKSTTSIIQEGEVAIMSNYPHPYVESLDPLIKFEFLTLNYTRSGKAYLPNAIREAADQAYLVSVNQDRDLIRNDLHHLVADMEKAGIVTVKSNEIYFPKNSEKFFRTFIRKYWDYVEKIGKRTLFDFEMPFQ